MSKIHFRDEDGQLEKIFENKDLQKYVAELINSSNRVYRFESFLAVVLISLKYVQLIG
ncbi:MAG TPA: hypothetical protein VI146_01265 [Nitrososphaeraceae archaeon]